MLSNKLTFSLASLVVLLALVFVTTPVMAQSLNITGGNDANVFRVGTAITDIVLDEVSGPEQGVTYVYSITPTLPAGLSFAAATRTLSGTPTAATSVTTYTYTASGGADPLTDTFTIDVNDNPKFAPGATIAEITGQVNTAITSVTLPEATDADDEDTITYTLDPTTLPAGLTFTAATRKIHGTPTAAALGRYTYVATSSGTDDTTATLRFVINIGHAPEFADESIMDISGVVGTAITAVTLPEAMDSDDAPTYAITPTLPAGLSFNASTRMLSGTPTAQAASATYTYTATDGTYSDTLTFMIAVTVSPAFAETVEIGDLIYVVGSPVSTVLPMATDADLDQIIYAISPVALPTGLQFNPNTRAITGTPTAMAEEADYTYTASVMGETAAELEFTITVNTAAPTQNNPMFAATDTIANITVDAGTAITTVTLPMATDADAADTITYAITPTLPAGLMFDPATRMLSGMPSAAATVATYTYTATSSDTAETPATLTFTITVSAAGDQIVPDANRALTKTVTADQAKKTLTVTWTAPTDTMGLTHYTVALLTPNADGSETLKVQRVETTAATLTHTFTGVSAGMHYVNVHAEYTVDGVRSSSGARGEDRVTILPDVTITTAATDLSASFDVTLTFTSMVALTADDILPVNGRVADGSVGRAHTTATDAGKVWQATIVPFAKATSVTVDVAATVATAAKVLTVSGEAPTLVTPDPTPKPTAGTIPANGYAILVHPNATEADHGIDDSKVALIALSNMPNLAEFFDDGGSIVISTTGTAAAGAVKISEIMWGTDASLSTEADPSLARKSQWIELYNTTGTAIAFNSSWSVEFTADYVTPATAVDSVSNLGNPGYWDVKGSSGRTIATKEANAVSLVSMYRKLKQLSDTTHADYGKDDGIPHRAGTWVASAKPRRNLSGLRVGTPGAHPSVRISEATAATQTVLINEIGNSGNDAYDWVEILNTTAAEINLKKWELNIVMADANGDPAETQLVSFPDNDDTKLPANGILLISNSDPAGSDNDLAAGTQVNKAADDQVKRGVESLYYIDSALDLPNDNSKYLLILRNANDKEGASTNIIDVGGTYFGSKNDATINTEVWPLQATAAGHGDVIDGDPPEDFRAGYVYKRNAVNSGIGEHHWARVGFTGVGYDRAADKSDENGGTPGYANDSLKEKYADLASDAEITISEIMFEAGAGRRHLAQWIELYNSSMTQGVNLNEWKLEIQNARDENLDARLNATITFGATTIAPNQTVLIVSTSGLNSGTGHFPNSRTINLWTDHRESLEMETRNDTVLSGTGFYLKLTDKDNKLVDEVGNTDGNRRTADAPAWALPMSSEEERRSSIIRGYEDGLALDGMMEASWVSASDTSLAYAISHTYFGSADDLGTPGFRGGGPLPVSLSSFRPVRDKATGAVVIRWTTESELDNAGFNILRSETKNGEFKVVNLKGIIAGHGTTSEKHTYEWKDTTAKPNVVYYYQIEDVSLDGERTTLRTTHLRGNVNAAGKATLRWGELKDSRY